MGNPDKQRLAQLAAQALNIDDHKSFAQPSPVKNPDIDQEPG